MSSDRHIKVCVVYSDPCICQKFLEWATTEDLTLRNWEIPPLTPLSPKDESIKTRGLVTLSKFDENRRCTFEVCIGFFPKFFDSSFPIEYKNVPIHAVMMLLGQSTLDEDINSANIIIESLRNQKFTGPVVYYYICHENQLISSYTRSDCDMNSSNDTITRDSLSRAHKVPKASDELEDIVNQTSDQQVVLFSDIGPPSSVSSDPRNKSSLSVRDSSRSCSDPSERTDCCS